MGRSSNHPFYFHHGYLEQPESGHSPEVDIGTIIKDEGLVVSDKTYSQEHSFFSLEAKRLPSPEKKREREYLVSHDDTPRGGVERFKRCIHGKELKYSAIIGYIQGENFDYWIVKLNSWIDQLIQDPDSMWHEDDKLVAGPKEHFYFQLLSDNPRYLKGTPVEKIKLFHFWINLVPSD